MNTLDIDARALFERWLAAPDAYHLSAFQVVSALRRLGYRIERRGMGLSRPWRLLRGDEVVAQEFYPLAVRCSAPGVRVLPEDTLSLFDVFFGSDENFAAGLEAMYGKPSAAMSPVTLDEAAAMAAPAPEALRLLWTWEGSAKALGALVAERRAAWHKTQDALRAAAAERGLLSREATDAA